MGIDSKWRDELLLLSSKTAEIQPLAAYSAYIHGFNSKYNFFNCTIPTLQNHMKITEGVLKNHFIPAIIGEPSISEHLQELMTSHSFTYTTWRNGSNNHSSQH